MIRASVCLRWAAEVPNQAKTQPLMWLWISPPPRSNFLWLYDFPMAAVTHCHNLVASNNPYFVLQFWKSEVWNEFYGTKTKGSPSWDSKGESVPYLSHLWRLLTSLGLWLPLSNLCFCPPTSLSDSDPPYNPRAGVEPSDDVSPTQTIQGNFPTVSPFTSACLQNPFGHVR